MTVRELIEKLELLPNWDHEVIVFRDGVERYDSPIRHVSTKLRDNKVVLT